MLDKLVGDLVEEKDKQQTLRRSPRAAVPVSSQVSSQQQAKTAKAIDEWLGKDRNQTLRRTSSAEIPAPQTRMELTEVKLSATLASSKSTRLLEYHGMRYSKGTLLC